MCPRKIFPEHIIGCCFTVVMSVRPVSLIVIVVVLAAFAPLLTERILPALEAIEASRCLDGKTMEKVTDFFFLGSKITADGDYSHEIIACSLEEKL